MKAYIYKLTSGNKLECMYADETIEEIIPFNISPRNTVICLRSTTHCVYNNISIFSNCCFVRKLTKSQESKLEKYLKKEHGDLFVSKLD